MFCVAGLARSLIFDLVISRQSHTVEIIPLGYDSCDVVDSS